MAQQIQLRRDTAANWASANPTPAQGEPCFEIDTGVRKTGDGVTAYNDLDPDSDPSGSAAAAQSAAISAAASDATTKANAAQSAAATDATTKDNALRTEIAGQYLSVYNVERFGAVGNNVADDTAAIQAAIDACGDGGGGTVYFPPGNYKITAALTLTRVGVNLLGAGRTITKISQATASENGIELGVATNPILGASVSYTHIERLSIDGVGSATSTGSGLSGLGTGYQGANLWLADMEFRDFDRGVYLQGWQSSIFHDTDCRYNRINWELTPGDGPSVINMQFENCSNVHADEIGIVIGAGIGCLLRGGDNGNQPMSLQVQQDGKAVWIGGNFESAIDGTTSFIDLGNNARYVSISQHFLKGTGAEIPAIRAGAGSFVEVTNPTFTGFLSTTAFVRKHSSTTEVIFGGSKTPMLVDDAGTLTTRGSQFVQVADSSIHTAAATNRGLVTWVQPRDSITTEHDRLIAVIKQKDGSYLNYDLIGPVELYSLTGASHGRSSGVRDFTGRVSFTTAAGEYTDVTVTVVAMNGQPSGCLATVNVGFNSNNRAFVTVKSWNTGAGTVTFRVWHPDDTGGSVSMVMHYRISAVPA